MFTGIIRRIIKPVQEVAISYFVVEYTLDSGISVRYVSGRHPVGEHDPKEKIVAGPFENPMVAAEVITGAR